MKKLTILSLLTVALAGVAVQKASAGVVVRASIGLPVYYAPAPAYYATPAPAPAYTYVPNYVYSTPPRATVRMLKISNFFIFCLSLSKYRLLLRRVA